MRGISQVALTACYGECRPCGERLGNGPGHYVEFPGFQGKIGFISALSHRFCGECNRIRLTSQGFLKTCLQYETGIDLKKLLRSGADDEEILRAAEAAIRAKPAGHHFCQAAEPGEEQKNMSQIGG